MSVVVTSGADSGPGTLREAIDNAVGGETITFTLGLVDIVLTSGQLNVDVDLTIDGGSGDTVVTVRRDIGQLGLFRIFNVSGDIEVSKMQPT